MVLGGAVMLSDIRVVTELLSWSIQGEGRIGFQSHRITWCGLV